MSIQDTVVLMYGWLVDTVVIIFRSPRVATLRGWDLAAEGKHAQAKRLLRSALRREPKNVEAITGLADELLFTEEHSEEALELAREAVLLDPLDAAAQGELGKILVHLGRFEEAVGPLELVTSQLEEPHSLYNLGCAYRGLGRKEDALSAFRRSVGAAPNDAHALEWLGTMYDELGRHEEAVGPLRRAITLDQSLVLARTCLGAALRDLKRYDEALPFLVEAVRLLPEEVNGWMNLGLVQGNLGRWREALQSFLQAQKLRPDLPPAHGCAGEAQAALGQWGEAKESFDRALALDPNYFRDDPERKPSWEQVLSHFLRKATRAISDPSGGTAEGIRDRLSDPESTG